MFRPLRPARTAPGSALAEPDGRFLDVDGIAVHHRVTGPVNAPAVVLFHHFYGSVATWRHVQDDLSRDHRVVSFDRAGFGLTQRPRIRRGRPNPYTRETSTLITLRLLDDLGIGRAVLMGSSAGGTAALETCARAPERVDALVLLSPAITGDVGVPRRFRPLLRRWPLRSIGRRIVRLAAGEITRERIARSWHDPSRATAADVDAYARPLRVEGWDRGFWGVMTAEAPPDLRNLLGRITAPTLVVAGASDRVISARWSQRTAEAIPTARFHLLEEVGHTPQEERPDLLLPVLRTFLADVDRR